MRRALAFIAVALVTLFTTTGMALALPTVKFKAEAVRIPNFPGTGNILGAGAAVQAEYKIEGTEYQGSPPPIIGVNFYLPKGSKLHTSGFPTCSKATLEQFGPIQCRKGSAAGPTGKVQGFVTLGGERVEEGLELSSFYAPGGGLEFFSKGTSPVAIEILSNGHYVNLGGAGGYGPELETEVPLVMSLPGAPFASVKSITVKAGSAYTTGKGKHKQTIYYGRVPTKCPKGGFPLKTEVIFAENGELSKPETVTKTYKAPCPPRKRR
jgi:hypothetical protein